MPEITNRSPRCQIVRTEYEIQRNSTNVTSVLWSALIVRTSVSSWDVSNVWLFVKVNGTRPEAEAPHSRNR